MMIIVSSQCLASDHAHIQCDNADAALCWELAVDSGERAMSPPGVRGSVQAEKKKWRGKGAGAEGSQRHKPVLRTNQAQLAGWLAGDGVQLGVSLALSAEAWFSPQFTQLSILRCGVWGGYAGILGAGAGWAIKESAKGPKSEKKK